MHITDIYWERVNLHIVLDEDCSDKSFQLQDKKKAIALAAEGNEVVINITNTPEGEMLDKGHFFLKGENEDISFEPSVLGKLEDASRIFKYNKGACAYLVTVEADESLRFQIDTSFMIQNSKYRKYHVPEEREGIYGKLAIVASMMFVKLINILYKILHFFAFNRDKRELYLTENATMLTGNLRACYEQRDKEKKAYIYAANHYARKSRALRMKRALKQVWYLARVNTIFVDNYEAILSMVKVSKSCRIVQVWHAGVGFKSVGYARFGREGSPHPYRSGHRTYTDVYVDKEELIPIYQEVFGVKKECFKATGIPRLQEYLNEDRIQMVTERLHKELPMVKGKKVILLSPTFRGVGSIDAYYDYNQIDFGRFNEFAKDHHAVVLIKMHPFVKNRPEIGEEYAENIVDCFEYDINELIYISDVMITDYSSCAYEFSLFQRPLIFYRYDKEVYEYLRPMHTLNVFSQEQYEVKTFDELLENLAKIM